MGDKPVMYFHFASGDTRLTFAVGSNPMAGQQPRTAGAGAVSSTTCANTASKRQGCGSRSGGCNSSSASMSETRNSTMALMPPPNSSQMNKTPASAGGRTICATSCKASCNMSRNSTIANRSVAQPPPSYQSFKTPQNKTSAQMYSTRKEQLSSTLLPGYEPVATEPTIIAGNTSMSKPCGPNISAYHSVSKSCCQKSSFVNATATSARRL